MRVGVRECGSARVSAIGIRHLRTHNSHFTLAPSHSRTLALGFLLFASTAMAQTSPGELHVRRLLATPIGGLPPVAMPMPASRDRNYWVGRLQAAAHHRNNRPDERVVAGGIDLQWQGGSVVGITAGYDSPTCAETLECPGHMLFGARARAGFMSGGPTLAAMFGDHTATTTFGAELGFGYAPNVHEIGDACTIDVGIPISISMLQRLRVVTFVSPGIAWSMSCLTQKSDDPTARSAASFVLGYGLGIQQLFVRGLDVNMGLQRIFREGTGIQFGISFIYVKLP